MKIQQNYTATKQSWESTTARVVYLSNIQKATALCACLEMCEALSGEEYYACVDNCEYTDECSRRNEESFELLKSVDGSSE